jgi:hypothetical protein
MRQTVDAYPKANRLCLTAQGRTFGHSEVAAKEAAQNAKAKTEEETTEARIGSSRP